MPNFCSLPFWSLSVGFSVPSTLEWALAKLPNNSTVYKGARLNLTRRAREVFKYSREYLKGSSGKPLLPVLNRLLHCKIPWHIEYVQALTWKPLQSNRWYWYSFLRILHVVLCFLHESSCTCWWLRIYKSFWSTSQHLQVLNLDLLLCADTDDTQNCCLSCHLHRICRVPEPRWEVRRREDLKILPNSGTLNGGDGTAYGTVNTIDSMILQAWPGYLLLWPCRNRMGLGASNKVGLELCLTLSGALYKYI